MILTRQMRLADPALTTLTYTMLVGAVGLSVPALLDWHELTVAACLLMLLGGTLSVISQYFQLQAFRCGSASLLAPFSYCSIIGSTTIGVVVFDNFPDRLTWLGTAIVISSGVYVWHRERVRARQAGSR
ncbi:MAG: DMT family transporter [Pseudomonadota bacterium]